MPHGLPDGLPDTPTAPHGFDPAHGPAHGAREELAGDQIGHYVLKQKLGEGGFGVVWLGERTTPMSQLVAIKILKAGMDSRSILLRFEQERATLAALEHPNIARIFDAGLTPAGRPYFAMEYVKGEPLTHYCDKERLDIERRLSLFVEVCSAVHHAHQRGIIHRDIKPGNVLAQSIDGAAVVKVIDFGVAKAIWPGSRAAGLLTEHGQFIGTPEYMSPEQAEGSADLDVRSDVYALGVLLYELLAGALPIDPDRLRSAALHEIVRLIREQEPERPSTRVASLARDASERLAMLRSVAPERLKRVLSSELEWIPLKALRKERARRYDSARDLARDVARFLASEPLEAGPESVAYRTDKLISRHARAIGACAIVLASLLLPIFGDIAFYRREGFVADGRGVAGLSVFLPVAFVLGVGACLYARVRGREPTANWLKIAMAGLFNVAMSFMYFAYSMPILARQEINTNLAEYTFQLSAYWWSSLAAGLAEWAVLVFALNAPRRDAAHAVVFKHVFLWIAGLLLSLAADVSALV